MDFYAGGHISCSRSLEIPVVGTSSVINWDFIAGGGVNKTLHGNYHGSGNFGAGVRFVLAQWITLNFDVRDYIFGRLRSQGVRS